MTYDKIFEQIKIKNSYLCIGLDTDMARIPKHLLKTDDPVFEFNKQIIDATHEHCVAYKLNLAFYESLGRKGFERFERTIDYIPKNIFTIADAKRGDVGNTSAKYAYVYLDHYNLDAITVSPYMGRDSVTPYYDFKRKWAIILALTSNPGADDFQMLRVNDNYLFEEVIKQSSTWGTYKNTMFVVGATRAEMLAGVRKIVPHHFLLIPGVGAQGGSLKEVSRYGMNSKCGLLVNSSRQIIYAGSGKNFAAKAAAEARKLRDEMKVYLEKIV